MSSRPPFFEEPQAQKEEEEEDFLLCVEVKCQSRRKQHHTYAKELSAFPMEYVVKMSKNEIKKQVIYLYVCYWPGLEDYSSRPGIVSRSSVVLSVEGVLMRCFSLFFFFEIFASSVLFFKFLFHRII